MSYDFFVDLNAAGNLGSGCTESLSHDWSGTVNISGTTVTKVTGDNFPIALLDGKHFIRIDPEGSNDSNIRIDSGGATTLTLAMSGATLTGVTAHIGGAFKSPEKAIGTGTTTATASKIPYADASSIYDAINIWIKPGLYILSAALYVYSATQESNHIRRRILGYGGGFVNGEFTGPDLLASKTSVITIDAPEISLAGLMIRQQLNSPCVLLKSNRYNFAMDNCQSYGGISGFTAQSGSCSNVIECRFDNHAQAAIIGMNTSVLRSVASGCYAAWGGLFSSYVACMEQDSTYAMLPGIAYPGSLDFSYCRFKSNVQISDLAMGDFQATFTNCTFDHAIDASSYSSFNFESCPVAESFTDTDVDFRMMQRFNTVIPHAGIDNYQGIFTPAMNLVAHYPDPEMDRYCRYTTAGPHEYPFPIKYTRGRSHARRMGASGIPKKALGLR